MPSLPGMIERKSGGILNVASTAAFQPGPGMAVYFATKAFVLSFSEALHDEVKTPWRQGLVPVPGADRAPSFGAVSGFDPKGRAGQDFRGRRFGGSGRPQGLGAQPAVVVPGLLEQG